MQELSCESNTKVWEEPIAIVGMGCRYPGDAKSPSKLWDLLDAGRSAISVVPPNRFNIDAWYHPDTQRPGSVSAKGGYFISNDDGFLDFDPSFFGISPKEATTMDPQQRKLLEVVYECFESAGITLEQLSGSQTGCFVGCFTIDSRLTLNRDVDFGAPYQVTGGGLTIVSNRVNYVFNLKGPSVSVDTACSSSLYALHLACQAVLAGDCSTAVVGGTNIILDIEQHLDTMRLGVLSPTSTCHTFDENADGFGRAEGIAAICIKRLSDAQRAGDPIRAVIRSTSINANGKSAGINHPSVQGQEECIRKAYSRAGLDFDQTGYFECHGTGTPVGDPIECEAIGNVFAAGRTPEEPLLLGSIKTNLGHTEGASGLASVMKAVLSMEKRRIPATIGIKNLNPNIDFKNGRLKVVQCSTPWPGGLKHHRASVNSFGYGGANAHVILETLESFLSAGDGTSNSSINGLVRPSNTQAIDLNGMNGFQKCNRLHQERMETSFGASAASLKEYLFVLSAHDNATLVRNLTAISEVARYCNAYDLAYTLGLKRSKFRYGAFGVSSFDNVAETLQEKKMVFGVRASSTPTLAFAFTGQGAQWPQMGMQLIKQYPVVLKTLRDLESGLSLLPKPPTWSIIEELSKPAESSNVYASTHSPPLCTAVQIALVLLLRSWGINPVAVVGHSSGEVAAAFCAGLLTPLEAMEIAYYRGVSCTVCHQPGAMLAVGLGPESVKSFLENENDVIVACHNSPESLTLSGGASAIDRIQTSIAAVGNFARKVNSSGNAYHSHLVKNAGQHYEENFTGSLPSLAGSGSKSQTLPMYSCIDGRILQPDEVGIKYWRKNLESPVLFDGAFRSMLNSQPKITHVIEIGVHSALAGPIKQIRASMGIDAERLTYLPSLLRGGDGVRNMLHLAGTLSIQGYKVDLGQINSVETTSPSQLEEPIAKSERHLLELPPYQWNYGKMMWRECRWSRELRFRKHGRHDLLGSREPGNSISEPLWRNKLSVQYVPWLADHKVGNDVIFPAAGYLAMTMEAVTQFYEDRDTAFEGYKFQNVHIKSPLLIPEGGDVEIFFNLKILRHIGTKESTGWLEWNVSSVTTDNKWTDHAGGVIAVERTMPDQISSFTEFERLAGTVRGEESDRRWYAALAAVGVSFGPSFQALSDILTSPKKNEAVASVALNTTEGCMVQESRYVIHPSTLDACLQLVNIAARRGNVNEMDKAYLPVSIDHMKVWKIDLSLEHPLPQKLNIYSQGTIHGLRSVNGEAEVFSDEGRVVLQMKANFASYESGLSMPSVEKPRQPYLRLVWQPDIEQIDPARIRTLFAQKYASESDDIKLLKFNGLVELCILECCVRIRNLFGLKWRPLSTSSFTHWLETVQDRLLMGPLAGIPESDYASSIETLISNLRLDEPEIGMINRMREKTLELIIGGSSSLESKIETQNEQLYKRGTIRWASCRRLGKLMNLYAQKKPYLKILEVRGGSGGPTEILLESMHGASTQPYYQEYTIATCLKDISMTEEKFNTYQNVQIRELDIEQDPVSQGYEKGCYDFIILSEVLYRKQNIQAYLETCQILLKDGGRLVLLENTKNQLLDTFLFGLHSQNWSQKDGEAAPTPFISKPKLNDLLSLSGFSGSDIVIDSPEEHISCATIVVSTAIKTEAVRGQDKEAQMLNSEEPILLVYRHAQYPIVRLIAEETTRRGIQTEVFPLSKSFYNVKPGSRVIMLAEIEGPILSRLTDITIAQIQVLMKKAASMIWITNGDLRHVKDPKLSLIFGFANVAVMEQPSLRLCTIDFDPDEINHIASARFIMDHEMALRNDVENRIDNHVIVSNGIPYISRYILDDMENKEFSRQAQPVPEYDKLRPGVSLDFRQVGDVESFFFKPTEMGQVVPQGKQVLLQPQFYSLSRKEALILKGQHNFASFSHECVAIVSDIGPDVKTLAPGNQVLCLASKNFESTFIIEEDLCEILHSGEDLSTVAGLLIPYCTAVNALANMANVRQGQTVLVHAKAEPVCIAAISISYVLGAKVLVTYDTDDEKDFLHKSHDIPYGCMFPADAASIDADIMSCTDGKGVDVVLAGLGVGNLTKIWSSLARNGSFVLTGGADIPDVRTLDVSVFSRGATFSSFDIMEMIRMDPDRIKTLMRTVMQHYREGTLLPLRTVGAYDIAALGSAVKRVIDGTCYGNVLLQYHPEFVVPILPSYVPLRFSSTATYLMVGCLGGLGRSLASWMATRGARHFVFLSRSGSTKPEAAAFVQEQEELFKDISIQIVQGDISIRADVDKAISLARSPIKGTVQAAMSLEEQLFDDMSSEAFNAVTKPKVQGTINLHEALLNANLDFFVMTSSIITTLPNTKSSNYAAANSFLDSMARFRRSRGLPAVSVALGMITEVGHVSAHPEIEAAMTKSGMHGINEQDFLRIMELACTPQNSSDSPWPYDSQASAHIITGLEPGSISPVLSKTVWLRDARLCHVKRYVEDTGDPDVQRSSNKTTTSYSILAEASAKSGVEGIKSAIQDLTLEKFSQVLLTPEDRLLAGLERPLSEFGMDSMIATEIRTWAWRSFEVDVPFLNLIGSDRTAGELVDWIQTHFDVEGFAQKIS